MKRSLLYPCLLFVTIAGCMSFLRGQERLSTEERHQVLLPYSHQIDEERLFDYLSVIAHDSLKGRETGMRGQKIAADYLADHYRDLGFTPMGVGNTYFQPFTLDAERTDSLVFRTYRVESGDTLLIDHSVSSSETSSDYIQIFGGSRTLEGGLVFAGFGVEDQDREVDHLNGIDLNEKWVIVFEDIPHIVDGDTLIDPDWNNSRRFSQIVSRSNAHGIIAIGSETEAEFEDLKELSRHLVSKPRNMRLPYLDGNTPRRTYPRGYLQVSPSMAVDLLDLDGTEELQALRDELTSNATGFEPVKLPYYLNYRPYNNHTEIETENVVALFEGDDPDLKDEVVVLTAHYDHIGITFPDETGNYINNGADDNGSGTVALMAIAESLQTAYEETGIRPARSILFLHVSAEEVGLLGSRFYSDHPVIPIDQTVASFNADMVGRSTTERQKSGDTDYIFIIGGDIISSELDSLVHAANDESVRMSLDYTYNDLNDPNQFYRRSDHWNFGRLGVPFVFFFTGVHEDYHNPGDQIEKIDFPKLTRTTQLIYVSTLQIANYKQRPQVDNEQFIEITRSRPR